VQQHTLSGGTVNSGATVFDPQKISGQVKSPLSKFGAALSDLKSRAVFVDTIYGGGMERD
jgi:hypothetical protein